MLPLQEKTRTAKESTWVGCLLLLSFLIYANTLFNGFVFDDHFQIEQNPYLQSASSIGQILTKPVWSFRGGEGAPNFYRPMMMLVYFVCHAFFGSSPTGYHLIQILLHVVVVWLVLATSQRLFGEFWRAFAAASIFALHPIHTESVAWLAGITDIELSAFFLLSFLFFLKLETAGKNQTWRLQTGMLFSFVAALLSKEVAVTLPVLATLFEHFYRADRELTSWRKKLLRYLGFWVLTAAYFVMRFTVFGGILSKSFHPDVTWRQAFLSGASLVGQYFLKFFWPWPLSFYYPFQKNSSMTEPGVLLGFVVLLGCIFLFFVLWRRERMQSFSILWIFATLGLVLNARWMPGTVFAERYWYLPSVGLAWLLGAGLVKLLCRKEEKKIVVRWPVAAAIALVVLLCATEIVARNRDWRSDYTLTVQTLKVRPHSAHYRVTLGDMDWQAGKHEQAVAEWRQALMDDPKEPFALWSMGRALLEQKRFDESLSYLQESIQAAPQYAAPHIYRGRVFEELGKDADAEKEFQRAIALNPYHVEARNSLGKFYLERGRFEEAAGEFRAALKGFPSAEAYKGLARACVQLGQSQDAEEAWKQVLALEPFDASAHAGLGKIYLALGRWDDAEREYRSVLLMNPKNEEALEAIEKIRLAKATHSKL